jgi:hypothetical protein
VVRPVVSLKETMSPPTAEDELLEIVLLKSQELREVWDEQLLETVLIQESETPPALGYP